MRISNERGAPMKLSVGENVKLLRKTKNITQEQLAEMLGVSAQSVSRWESGVCYPDIELLPLLAETFNVTVDQLLGVDDVAEKKKVEDYLGRFQVAINQGEIEECISIARAGVAEYPNNYALLNKLMCALFVSGDDSGNIPDWKENMEKYDAEITALGERIMRYCPDQDIRLEAISRLAFNHCEHGRKETGKEIYEMLPTMSLCRETQMWWSLHEDEKLPFLYKQIKDSFGMLKNFVYTLAACEKLSAEDCIRVIDKWEQLDLLVREESGCGISVWIGAKIPCDKARWYAQVSNVEAAYEQLEVAAKKAIAFDCRPEVQEYHSLLLGHVSAKRVDFEMADTRPLTSIMRDTWLQHETFDSLRNTAEFQRIVAML